MRKGSEIEINPDVLKNLRKNSGYTIEEIAKKLKTSTAKVQEVEKGISFFTITQIKKLAGVYQLSLAAFFTGTLPRIPALPDFRINRDKRLTPQVYAAKRRAYYLANKLKELTDKRSRTPDFPDSLSPDELALEFRKYLRVDLFKSEKPNQLLANYKQILEEQLQVSIIELPLKAEDVRGFSISGDISIVVLNEGDHPSIKLFSLFHETYHLIKRSSGICSIEIEQSAGNIEADCNLFAAEFLAPLDDLDKEFQKLPQLSKESFTEEDDSTVSTLSQIYGVSKHVIMLRLLRLGYVTQKSYEQFKKAGEAKAKGKRFGRRDWDKVFHNRVGDLVVKETASAYRAGKISYAEVMDILRLKVKYTEKLIERSSSS